MGDKSVVHEDETQIITSDQCIEEAKLYISGKSNPYDHQDRINWLIQKFFDGIWYDPKIYELLWDIDDAIRKGKPLKSAKGYSSKTNVDTRNTNTETEVKELSVFKFLSIDINKVYPALVVSTMSSGKSTLINALVGSELLPSMNQACTSKAVAILDNDLSEQIDVHTADKAGKYMYIKKASRQSISELCKSDDISEMIIEGEVKGIKNSKKSLLLIDTPGINNSRDLSHEAVTTKVLDECSEGLIIYVINVQQVATYDDYAFLSSISKRLKDNDKFNIVFVVNKMDLIDPTTEKPGDLIENCKKYIENKDIENPVIIPVSANGALLFKKALAGEALTEFEEENFRRYYKHFKRESFSLQDYAYDIRNGNLESRVYVDGQDFTRGQLLAALDSTGVPLLERTIDEMLVRSLKIKAPKIAAKNIDV